MPPKKTKPNRSHERYFSNEKMIVNTTKKGKYQRPYFFSIG